MYKYLKKPLHALILATASSLILASSTIASTEYVPNMDFSKGTITIHGSSTVGLMMNKWANDFSRIHPNVKIKMETSGSTKGAKALYDEQADLAAMSRNLESKESRAFKKKFDTKPIKFTVGLDAIAIIVNKSNPLDILTIQEVDAIFSKTLACGGASKIDRWGQLGISGDLKSKSIKVIGNQAGSDSYTFFRKKGLCHGRFTDSIQMESSNMSVLKAVSSNKRAIAFIGANYVDTKRVKVLSLPARYANSGKYIKPDLKAAKILQYPLSRHLNFYINPNGENVKPEAVEFLRFVFSKMGQKALVQNGFLPSFSRTVERNLDKLSAQLRGTTPKISSNVKAK